MSEDIEDIESFRDRARKWVVANLPGRNEPAVDHVELQRRVFDGGFAGIAFPIEYGGAGLTLAHQKVFYDAASDADRQIPIDSGLMVSVGMLAPTLLEHGSDEAKKKFLPPLLRGDDIWIQLLSEPRGGSDMAGAITRLTRDGDCYILSGAKMWSTGAYRSDYGLCLCRTDWDAPKHHGLSMIAVPLGDSQGVSINRTRTADGRLGDICEEFFDDVELPAVNLIGEENAGWAVAQALLFHERNAVSNLSYGYFGRDAPGSSSKPYTAGDLNDLVRDVAERDLPTDGGVRQLIADVYIEETVLPLTSERVMTGIRSGTHSGPWGSLIRLEGASAAVERVRTALAVEGAAGVIWDGVDVEYHNPGTAWLFIREVTLAGGSSEMQRNIISERLLGLPREPSSDRDTPFSEVIRRQSVG